MVVNQLVKSNAQEAYHICYCVTGAAEAGAIPPSPAPEERKSMDRQKTLEEIILEKVERLPDFQKGRIVGILETIDDKNLISGLIVDKEGNMKSEKEHLAQTV